MKYLNHPGINWRQCHIICICSVIVIAVMGLIGYLPGLGTLGSVKKEYIPMAPATAICFILLGIAMLFVSAQKTTLPGSIWFLSLAFFVSIFGLLGFIGYYTGLDLNFENTLVPVAGTLNGIPIARMSPATGAVFFFSGAGVCSLILQQQMGSKNLVFKYLADGLGMLVLIISFFFCLAYLYGTPLLYTYKTIIPMALTTALGFLLLSVSILTVPAARFFFGLSTRNTTQSYLLGFILPLAVLSVLSGGVTVLVSLQKLHVNPAVTSAALTIVVVVTAGIISTWISRHMGIFIDRQKEALRQSEEELRMLKDNLEIEVAKKTEELEERVTELNHQRFKLALSNQELEAFAYSVSHDLRAPLRAIDGYSKFLLEDYAKKLDNEGKRFIATIRQNAARMDQLISDLLSLSRVSRVEMHHVPVDMGAVAESIYQESATDEEKDHFAVIINTLPRVSCDLSLIKRVWQNLIGNALKYSRGSLVKKIEISAREEQGQVVFCIKDHGAGFDDRYVDKLFGVFQRLHKEDEFTGSGVGLAIVQRIVHRHGGQVWAKGTVNKGAEIYFSLPRN